MWGHVGEEARGWTPYCRSRSVSGGAGAAQGAPAQGELRRGGRLPPCRAAALWPVLQVRRAAKPAAKARRPPPSLVSLLGQQVVPEGRERALVRPCWEWQAPSPIRAPGREWHSRPDALTNGIAGPGWAVRVGVARGRVWASQWGCRQSGAEVSVERSRGAILARRDTSQCSPIGIRTPAPEQSCSSVTQEEKL